ncbi:hypothetical protein [Rhizobium sp. SG741]|uniref:hypothetical protein n=1 Tax=Rhizobium sp. SG741 TaxID=2587114 RepID=UPI0014462848|nr:hypothetical protein [Rhizobium sp. SG741]NKJ04241.1 putative membrane protein [Rhizobium sp. SG741]
MPKFLTNGDAFGASNECILNALIGCMMAFIFGMILPYILSNSVQQQIYQIIDSIIDCIIHSFGCNLGKIDIGTVLAIEWLYSPRRGLTSNTGAIHAHNYRTRPC